MVEKKQLTQLKKLSSKRAALMAKVHDLDARIEAMLDGISVKKAAAKQDYPNPGSGPDKLCKAMSSRPKSKEQIAQKTGLSLSTVTAYLSQFNCFESAGRGKGYIYKKPETVKK